MKQEIDRKNFRGKNFLIVRIFNDSDKAGIRLPCYRSSSLFWDISGGFELKPFSHGEAVT